MQNYSQSITTCSVTGTHISSIHRQQWRGDDGQVFRASHPAAIWSRYACVDTHRRGGPVASTSSAVSQWVSSNGSDTTLRVINLSLGSSAAVAVLGRLTLDQGSDGPPGLPAFVVVRAAAVGGRNTDDHQRPGNVPYVITWVAVTDAYHPNAAAASNQLRPASPPHGRRTKGFVKAGNPGMGGHMLAYRANNGRRAAQFPQWVSDRTMTSRCRARRKPLPW